MYRRALFAACGDIACTLNPGPEPSWRRDAASSQRGLAPLQDHGPSWQGNGLLPRSGGAGTHDSTLSSAPSSSSSPSKLCLTHTEYDSILTCFAAAPRARDVRLHPHPHEHENRPLPLQQTPPRSVAFGRASWPRTLPRLCIVAAPQPPHPRTCNRAPNRWGPQTCGRKNGRGRERGKVAPEWLSSRQGTNLKSSTPAIHPARHSHSVLRTHGRQNGWGRERGKCPAPDWLSLRH
jgi:hypothetical protein